jgi:hypothetical protein
MADKEKGSTRAPVATPDECFPQRSSPLLQDLHRVYSRLFNYSISRHKGKQKRQGKLQSR